MDKGGWEANRILLIALLSLLEKPDIKVGQRRAISNWISQFNYNSSILPLRKESLYFSGFIVALREG